VKNFKEYLEQVQERELFRIRNWKKESLSGLADFIYTKFKNLGITNSLNNEMKPIFNYAKRLISKNKSQ
jgi:hypothetical protein